MVDAKEGPSLAQRLMERGVKKSHAYALASGNPGVGAAIRAFRRTGIKLGPIEHATDDEIAVLERFGGRPGDPPASAA